MNHKKELLRSLWVGFRSPGCPVSKLRFHPKLTLDCEPYPNPKPLVAQSPKLVFYSRELKLLLDLRITSSCKSTIKTQILEP